MGSSNRRGRARAERERMLFDPKGTKWVLYGTLLIWALAFFVIGFRTAHDQTASDGIDSQRDKRDIEPNIAEEGDGEEKDDDDDGGSADHDENDDEEDDKDLEEEEEEEDDIEERNERRKRSYTKTNKKNKLAKS